MPPFLSGEPYIPSIGALAIAGSVLNDHEAAVTDFGLEIKAGKISCSKDIYDQCASKIMADLPEIVGFSTNCLTLVPALAIASRIKAVASEPRIILGGPGTHAIDSQLLKNFSFIDFVVRGESDLSFGNLVDTLQKSGDFSEVSGITYRTSQGIARNENSTPLACLDNLPPPAFGLYPNSWLLQQINHGIEARIPFDVGRGCRFNCAFCAACFTGRREAVMKSINRVLGEIQLMQELLGYSQFMIAHDDFLGNRRFVLELCQELRQWKPAVGWSCRARLADLDVGLFDKILEAGCDSLHVGLETASHETGKRIEKGVKQDEAVKILHAASSAGIPIAVSFIAGFPWESWSDIEETLSLAAELACLNSLTCHVHILTPLPGTGLMGFYRERLVRGGETAFSFGLEFNSGRRLSADEKMISDYPDLFSSFFLYKNSEVDMSTLSLFLRFINRSMRLTPHVLLELHRVAGLQYIDIFDAFCKWLGDIRGDISTTFSHTTDYDLAVVDFFKSASLEGGRIN